MPSETPDLAELLGEAMAATIGRIQTAIPAAVVTYDPARQVVTAKPTVSGRYQDPDTFALVPYPLPTVANVPVAFPSSAGFAITWPLAPGDTVYLVCASRSLDEWKASGAPETVPQDTRRCDLTDAVAIPGLRPFSQPIPPTGWSPAAMVLEGVDIRLGSSAAVSPVVLETLLSAFLAQLKVWLDTHTHGGVLTGPGVTATPIAPSPAAGTLGTVKIKAE
ncbi:MAG TPA: Gp138 family membrane-puncturing spike protein [Actinoplanes sp.]|nr:Gp138 family membrane-puncturing spike protein [Actinoplanes sp.]